MALSRNVGGRDGHAMHIPVARRLLGFAFVGLALATVLASCSDDEGADPPTTPTAAASSAPLTTADPEPTPEPAPTPNASVTEPEPIAEKAETNLTVEVVGRLEMSERRFVTIDSDPEGLPFVTYFDGIGNRLVVVHCLDPRCLGSQRTPIVQPMHAFRPPSVVFDAAGLPLIATAEFDSATGEIYLTLRGCRDENCTRINQERFDTRRGASAAVSADGTVMVATSYTGELLIQADTPDGFLIYRCSSGVCDDGWSETVVLGAGFGREITLILDADGRPQGLYALLGVDRNISLSRCSEADCRSIESTAVITLDVAQHLEDISISAATQGPSTAVLVDEGSRLTLTTWNEDTATARTVVLLGPDSQTLAGRESGLAVTSDGRPVVAFVAREGGLSELRVATCDDSSCESGVIATVARGEVSRMVDMALDVDDHPVLVYRDPLEVNVARCVDQTCVEGALAVSSW